MPYIAERGRDAVGSSTADFSMLTVTVQSPTAIAVGNHLIMRMIFSNNRTVAVTDDAGNTWQQDEYGSTGSAGTSRLAVFSCRVANAYQAGDEITVTLTGGNVTAIGAVVHEFSGLAASGWFDRKSSNPGDNTAEDGAWDSLATSTTGQADSLLVGFVGYNAGLTSATPETVSPAWTSLGDHLVTPNTSRSTGGHYRVVDTAGSYNYAGMFSSVRTHRAVILVYALEEGGASLPQVEIASVTALSTTSLRVTFSEHEEFDDYEVERDGTTIATEVPGSPFDDTGLSSNTEYSYRVRGRALS
jgi:hypothetical protein